MKGRIVFSVGVLACALAAAPRAEAQSPQDRATARHLMDEGDAWVEKKRLDRALEAYEGADALMHVPTTAIEVAKTLAALGRLNEAYEKALDVARAPAEVEPRAFSAARREAAQLAERLDKRIPTVKIVLADGSDASSVRASVDGQPIPEKATLLERRVDPGRHAIELRAGDRVLSREVEVKENDRAEATFDLAAGDAKPATATVKKDAKDGAGGGSSTLLVAGLGVAAAGVAIGSVTGLISLSKAADARHLCGPDAGNCDPAATDTIGASRTLGWVSTAAFALALAGVGVATYALVAPKKKDAPRVEAWVSGGAAGLRGSFR